jgi:hypothetical protein
MTPLRLVLAVLVCALALAPEATAGGWWSFAHVDRQTVAVGEGVRVQSEAWFMSVAEAREAEEDGRFYVYLLRDLDMSMVGRAMSRAFRRNWWSLGDADAFRVARVRVDITDANIGSANASFVMPKLALGTYSVMLCDAGCNQPLGTAVPTPGFTVVADPATARLARRLDRVQRRVAGQGRRLGAAREAAQAAAGQAQEKARAVGWHLVRLEKKLNALERQIRDKPDPGSSALWQFGGWLVAATLALVLATLLSRRRRSRSPERTPLGWSAEDEVLLASELSHPRRARTPTC